jgi:hypothetical protein
LVLFVGTGEREEEVDDFDEREFFFDEREFFEDGFDGALFLFMAVTLSDLRETVFPFTRDLDGSALA